MATGLRIISLAQLKTAPERNCGECTMCCDIMGVAELGKPYYARCSHLGGNCTIYMDRPRSCRTFRCAWHIGLMGDNEDRRPDRSGLMFDFFQHPDGGGYMIEVYETIPGTLAGGKLPYLLQKLFSHKNLRDFPFHRPTVAVYPYGSKIHIGYQLGPEYGEWTAPVDEMPLKIDPLVNPDQGTFAGEIRPLLIPKPPEETK